MVFETVVFVAGFCKPKGAAELPSELFAQEKKSAAAASVPNKTKNFFINSSMRVINYLIVLF